MSDELVLSTPISLADLPGANPLATKQDAFISGMATEWVPRLQLNSASSQYGKQHVEHINTYGIIRSETDVTILGKSVTILPLAFRPMALDMRVDKPKSYHDPASAEFKAVQSISGGKDSKCMWGAQFLLWLPEAKQFVTFFLGSKSSRKLGPSFNSRINKSAKLGSETIKTPDYVWQNPTIEDGPPFSEMPTREELTMQVERFLNPPASQVVTAEAPADTESR